MRTTVSIPDEYYHQIEVIYKEKGFNTINDLILALVRSWCGKQTTVSREEEGVEVTTTVMPREIPKVPTPKEYKPTPVLATSSIKPCSHGILFGCGKCKT